LVTVHNIQAEHALTNDATRNVIFDLVHGHVGAETVYKLLVSSDRKPAGVIMRYENSNIDTYYIILNHNQESLNWYEYYGLLRLNCLEGCFQCLHIRTKLSMHN
jgi:hypothetical protein